MPETDQIPPEPSDEEDSHDPWEAAVNDLDVESLDPSEQLRRELLPLVGPESQERINQYFALHQELIDNLGKMDQARNHQIMILQTDIIEYMGYLYPKVGERLRNHRKTAFQTYFNEQRQREKEVIKMMLDDMNYLEMSDDFIDRWEVSRRRELTQEDFTPDKRYKLDMRLKDLYHKFKRKFHPDKEDSTVQTYFLDNRAVQLIVFSFLDKLFPPTPPAP